MSEVEMLEFPIIVETTSNTIEGTPNNDTLIGTSGNDIIRGLEGDDALRGQEGDDTLDGGPGSDRLTGGDGNDTFVVLFGEGRDTIFDFVRGEDLFSSNLDFAELNIDVRNGNVNIADRTTNNILAVLRDVTEFTQEDYAFPIIQGTPGNDTLRGTRDADIIKGLEGDDVLRGELGNDTIDGGPGIDRLTGGDGADTFVVLSGEGKDAINDFVRGEDLFSSELDFAELNTFVNNGNLNIVNSNTREIIAVLRNTTEFTQADYVSQAGPQVNPGVIEFNSVSFSVNEDGTTDTPITLLRTGGSDGAVAITVIPTDGTATAPDDYDNTPVVVNFAAGETSQTVTIPIVDDTEVEEDETINLALSDPTNGATIGIQSTSILTIIDNDVPVLPIIEGTANNDTITGTTDAEIIKGLEGDDVIRAEAGDDILDGGLGNDRLNGQGGSDTFVVLSGEGKDTINDFVPGEDIFSSDLDFAELNTFVNNGNLNIVDSNTNNIFAVLRNTTELNQSDYMVFGDI